MENYSIKFILAYDVLLDHPELIIDPESISDVVIQLPPDYCEGVSEVTIGDAEFVVPEIMLFALASVRDNTTNSRKVRNIARNVLEAIAGNCPKQVSTVKCWGLREAEDVVTVAPSATILAKDMNSPMAMLHWMIENLGYMVEKVGKTILLTNLPEFQEKAKLREIDVMSFHFKPSVPYDGFRHIALPADLYFDLQVTHELKLEDFMELLPCEPAVFPNEYLIIYPPEASSDNLVPGHYEKVEVSKPEAHTEFYGRLQLKSQQVLRPTEFDRDGYRLRIFRYHAGKKKFISLYDVRRSLFDSLPEGYPELAAYTHALDAPDIGVIIVQGDAGTGKTYTATKQAVEDCDNGRFMHIEIFAPGYSEIGALPGDMTEKMALQQERTRDVLRSIVLKTDNGVQSRRKNERKFGLATSSSHDDDECASYERSSKMSKSKGKRTYESHEKFSIEDGKHSGDSSEGKQSSAYKMLNDIVDQRMSKLFDFLPHEALLGCNVVEQFIIIDESQRVDYGLMKTAITRPAQGSKIVILGDTNQPTVFGGRRPEVDGLTYASVFYEGGMGVAQFTLHRSLRNPIVSYGLSRLDEVYRRLGVK
ncbi:MAG: PhoH family protein [Candidatus Saccharibacteria bacterium]|nr:PhoH family protein [Candidatus Saccharibacteria bacterium]